MSKRTLTEVGGLVERLHAQAQHARGGLPAGDEVAVARALDEAAAMLERLEAERDEAKVLYSHAIVAMNEARGAKVAAEAEVKRLREGLREACGEMEDWMEAFPQAVGVEERTLLRDWRALLTATGEDVHAPAPVP